MSSTRPAEPSPSLACRTLVFLTLCACSTPHDAGLDDPRRVAAKPRAEIAGGQSGTDADGAFNCRLEGAIGGVTVPLDVVPSGFACSPNEVVAAVGGVHQFECASGTSLIVDVEGGTGARLAEGTAYRGYEPTAEACPLLLIDATTTISHGEQTFSTAGQLVVGRFCNVYLFADDTAPEPAFALQVSYAIDGAPPVAHIQSGGDAGATCSVQK